MKIAVVSDDGVTISQHFGRAPYYVVLTVENNQIVARETRDKVGHGHGHEAPEAHAAHTEGGHHGGHGFDAASQSIHARMASGISDCQVLLARGMGAGAYQSLSSAAIRPIVTDIANIDDAVKAFLAGTLIDHTERLH